MSHTCVHTHILSLSQTHTYQLQSSVFLGWNLPHPCAHLPDSHIFGNSARTWGWKCLEVVFSLFISEPCPSVRQHKPPPPNHSTDCIEGWNDCWKGEVLKHALDTPPSPFVSFSKATLPTNLECQRAGLEECCWDHLTPASHAHPWLLPGCVLPCLPIAGAFTE